MKLATIKELKLMANTIRQDVIRMLVPAASGHTAGPLGLSDIFSILFFHEMNYKPEQPKWGERDRFVLSNGHVCAVLYASMARAGYYPIESTLTFRKMGSKFQGHPSRHWLPEIENSSGPLGEGLAIASGIAMAGKLDKKEWRVYCVTSDGEHQEGSTWEAVMFAAKYKLDNLVAICDRNYIQIDGNTEEIMPLGDMAAKYRAFGWNAVTVNGHDYKALLKALDDAKKMKGRPTMIIAETMPGKGVSFVEGKYEWHGKPPSKEEGEKAIAELEEERKRIEAQPEGL
ncbi:1-deoxy-D-xylulose-5-phosphate synthase [uncultured archaeon]|nr:1-deoxy-D-xylulose-5-phosphate synthase [uncultured archaeon]